MAAAPAAWGDEEYETDPEDAPLRSMRRREASDDEDGEPTRTDSRAPVGSDAESDGQGGAQVYDNDDDNDDVSDEDGELEDYYDEEEFEEVRGGGVVEVSPKEVQQSLESEDHGDATEHGEGNRGDEEGKKENEPYAVPTGGTFYMHDDRFQDNARGRRRRIFGRRKLWDPKDEHAWVHDRFEEMDLQDARHGENNRRSRGRFRGHGGGKNRGGHRQYGGGSRHYAFNHDVNDHKQPSRPVRGRGPRRYEAFLKSSRDIPDSGQKQPPAKIQEPATDSTSKKKSSQVADTKMDPVVPQKHAFASRLNFASPPFYPSGSSNLNQDISLTQKRDAQTGNSNKGITYSMHMGEHSPTFRSSLLPRGKTVVDTFGHERLYMNESHQPGVGKSMGNTHLQPSGFSLAPDIAVTSSSFKAPPNNQYVSSTNQAGRVSSHIQSPIVAETPFQPVVSAQQFVQHSSTGNQISSPSLPAPSLPSANSSEVGETDSPPGSSESRTSLAGKGRSNNQGTYSGDHVLGSTGTRGLSQGDQNFPRTPALLPVMQFGGQHPGGVGVPAVGMVVPGYVAQQRLGSGNSEMTWVPVLAGIPGALGTSYCPPYITLDGNYYGCPSGQNLSSAFSKETSTIKPVTPTSQSDSVGDEVGQRQNKPRRYSEMNFGQ